MMKARPLRYLFLVSFLSVAVYSCKVSEVISFEQVDVQIESLLKSMTVEEKVGQTCQITLDVVAQFNGNTPADPALIDKAKLKEALVEYKVGSILNVGSHTLSRDEWNSIINDIHKPYQIRETKIPVIYGIDAIHGMNYTVGGTLFPQEIGLAATWNPQLVEACAAKTAYEVRASGIPWNFSPVLDLGRNPLWSRHFETLGEDPYLCSELGAAMIYGYQGRDSIGSEKVAACMKHYVGYSAAQSGRDRTPAWIPEKYMRELYLPSFKKAVESGALTVMVNSGSVNGVPGHINYHLLTEVLKGEFGFEGFAVSDWEDFIMLHTVHNSAESLEKAYVSAFNAGVDMSMVPLSPQYKEYCNIMVKAVKSGEISMQRLDDAVRRILMVKKKVGLFDSNSFDPKKYPDFASDESKKLSLNAALESITLLKNEGNCLPLSKGKKVLIAGPTANNLIFLNGAWTHTWQGVDTSYNSKGCFTVKESFENYIGKEKVLYSEAAKLYVDNGFERTRLVNIEDYKTKLSSCDVVILCLGEMPSTEKPGDIHSLNLDSEQLKLAELAYEAKKEVVVVLLEGRPRIIRNIVSGANAIIQGYLPGDYGAEALVKLIYGESNFSGRLPYTYPKYDGVIEFYDHPRSVDRSKSGDFSAYDPQWDFGFGLSYGSVEYSDLKLSADKFSGDEKLTVTVTVSNKGKMNINETVQMYLTDDYASIVPAGKRLRGFNKINIAPGKSQSVTFEIDKNDLIFYDNNANEVLETGNFTIKIKQLEAKFFYN
jgi:beta-glucosidase